MFTAKLSEYSELDNTRLLVSKNLDPARRIEFGQFMTPNSIASFMASLFTYGKNINLLDPGAGIGSLTSAFLEIAVSKKAKVDVDCWEIDSSLRPHLNATLSYWKDKSNGRIVSNVHSEDFIEESCFLLGMHANKFFTHAILNPPYKKINSNSKHRRLLSEIGVETVNLYSAFVALSIEMLSNDGELVAIIPRSFCNGTYYLPFRELLLRKSTIKHIHLFKSRNKAFKDDDVLQENIIIHLSKTTNQGEVVISTSTDSEFIDYSEYRCGYESIVDLSSVNKFIHIPSNNSELRAPSICIHTLSDIGIQVSTGPVVDFRAKDYLLSEVDDKSIPLIYSHNFIDGKLVWPKAHKKPNGLRLAPEIKKLLMPKGHYVLVKRFSSKEEKRRLVAYHLSPDDLKSDFVGFENHLNVYHNLKEGLDELLARGLTFFLNSKIMDDHFRVFSGHTQVNATDLRAIRYPSIKQLKELGKTSPEISKDQFYMKNIFNELHIL